MRWSLLCGVTIAILLIVWWEWSKMKTKPKWDLAVFVFINIAAWLLFLLDLPHTPGPASVLEIVFGPFKGLLQP